MSLGDHFGMSLNDDPRGLYFEAAGDVWRVMETKISTEYVDVTTFQSEKKILIPTNLGLRITAQTSDLQERIWTEEELREADAKVADYQMWLNPPVPWDEHWEPTAPVLGVRGWILSAGALHPQSIGRTAWVPGENAAVCNRSPYARFNDSHAPPHEQCTCGLHAYHPEDCGIEALGESWGDNIDGLISGWGRMVIHSDGFRCQYAEIAALVSANPTKQERRAAKNYEVPLLRPEQLEGFMLEVEAEPIPQNQRPPKKRRLFW